MRLEGVGDREAAAALTGELLARGRGRARPLEEDEWLAARPVGCEVAGRRDGDAGRRRARRATCSSSTTARSVPLVGDAIKSIDTEARRIEIDRHFLGLA